MLNIIWGGMIILSLFCAIFTGRMNETAAGAAEGADKAIRLVISLAGTMCLWSGVMKIAEKSGLTRGLSRVLSPALRRLMPGYEKNGRVMQAVSANVTANLLGLGNAATPLGLIAMKEMQKENPLSGAPDDRMIMFVVLNTASVQLIPTTIAAMRQAAGSAAPYSILPNVWLASGVALLTGILMSKLLSRSGRSGRCGHARCIN